MTDRTGMIFYNEIDKKTIRQAEKSKQKFLKKFGDDSSKEYDVKFEPIEALDHSQAMIIVISE